MELLNCGDGGGRGISDINRKLPSLIANYLSAKLFHQHHERMCQGSCQCLMMIKIWNCTSATNYPVAYDGRTSHDLFSDNYSEHFLTPVSKLSSKHLENKCKGCLNVKMLGSFG